ncbi:MAG: hypothetical protein R2745_07500 [Vicinamibacterales bacterium]
MPPHTYPAAALAVCLVCTSAHAQTPRLPIRLEVDLAAGFVRVAGNALTDRTVDRLDVEGWRPGLAVGARVRPWLEVAGTVSPGLDLRLAEPWGFGEARDARAIVDHRTGAILGVEARVFPSVLGVYGAVGVLHARPTRYVMSAARTGPTLALGSGDYATDVTAVWRARALTTPAVGLGYARRARARWSFTEGVSIPLRFPESEPATFSFSPGAAVSDAAVASATRVLTREVFYAPIAFHLSAGWTF